MRVGAAGAAAAMLLAGCGLVPSGQPEWFTNRTPLASCGTEVVSEEPDVAARQCLLEAYRAGRGAELITRGQMETGAPLTSYLRVHEDGSVEMILNLEADPSAPGAWERFRCEALVPDPDHVFIQEDCQQLPVP
jgi:hypothetical protein